MARPSDPNARIDLLAAAERVFAERGLDNTKVEDITERAGRSKGSFYLHFSSKEEAFQQVVEGMIARMRSFIDRQAEVDRQPPTSLEQMFDQWIASSCEIFEFVWQNRGVMALVLRGGLSAGYAHLMDEFAQRVHRHIHDSLMRGMERGIFRADIDIEITSWAMAGAYDRIARQVCEAPRRPDFERILRAIDSALLGGIGTNAVRKHLIGPARDGRLAPRSSLSPARAAREPRDKARSK